MTTKNKLIVVSIVLILFISQAIYFYKKAYRENYNYAFYGVVKKVQYDIKGTPTVFVNGVSYYLSYNNWDFNHKIAINDSIEKKKHSMVIRLKKTNSGNIFLFGR